MPTHIPIEQYLKLFSALEQAHDEMLIKKKRGAKLDDLVKEISGQVPGLETRNWPEAIKGLKKTYREAKKVYDKSGAETPVARVLRNSSELYDAMDQYDIRWNPLFILGESLEQHGGYRFYTGKLSDNEKTFLTQFQGRAGKGGRPYY